MTDEQFQAMLDIHLVAPFRILRAASGLIRETAKREAAEGRRVMRKVVNITSIAGTDGNAGQAGYSSAKAGVIGLTKTMAKEWGRYNVNVNSVGFGLIETRLTQPLRTRARRSTCKGGRSPWRAAEGAGSDESGVSAGPCRHGGGSGRRGAVLLLAALGLRDRGSADLRRGNALLMWLAVRPAPLQSRLSGRVSILTLSRDCRERLRHRSYVVWRACCW